MKMYELSKPQRLVYDMEKYAGGSISVICGSVIYKGEKSRQELENAVNHLYQMNDALRMRVICTNEGVKQEVGKFVPHSVETLSFVTKEDLDFFANWYAKEPLDLKGKLCEIKIVFLNEGYGLLIKMHHLIGDAWAMSLICSQFSCILRGEAPMAYSYTEYLKREDDYRQSGHFPKDRAFFLEQFKKCDEILYLSEKKENEFCAERKSFVIGGREQKRITAYTKEHHVSVFVLFMTALAVYMNRVKDNAERFYLGSAVINRTRVEEKHTAGVFVNVVPVLIELDNSASFEQNLYKVQQNVFSVLRHQKYHYGDVLSDIRKEYHFSEKLYDVVLNFQNAEITGTGEEFESTWYHNGMQTESMQIHIDKRDGADTYRIHYDYQTEKFKGDEIRQMHQYLMNLLTDAMKDDSKRLYELEMLSVDEHNKILYDFNKSAAEYPRNQSVHRLFEEQVLKIPDEPAVIARDKILTYLQLNEQANRIAHSLMEMGVKRGDLVAFALPRKSYLLAVIFGILKAGAAYLPIDPQFPEERINYILKDSQAKIFITDESVGKLLENDKTFNPEIPISGEDLCYCIYTSGTTGNPKGVLVRHRNLINICSANERNCYQTAALAQEKILLSTAKCCFDAFAIDYGLFLLNGSAMILADDSDITDGARLAQLAVTYYAEALQSTPSTIRALCLNDAYAKMLRQIKVLILAAENLTSELYTELRELTDAEIFNGYGPSETTVGACIGKIDTAEIHMGEPIANTQIYLVDRFMQPVPVGVKGELCVAGDGVSAGYLNRRELTEEKFVDNPFGDGRLYKTGDYAYWRRDGKLVYAGRRDFQVKIRGLRVELEEIEQAIAGVEGVSQACVVVRKGKDGRQMICGFYTVSKRISVDEIKETIRKRLPRYMIPHIFMLLPQMPLTTNGKIDKNTLLKMDLDKNEQRAEYLKPEGQLQKRLATIMAQVLDYSSIGCNDDFFDLGGDSLRAIEFVSKAHNEGIYFSLQNIFDHPTLRELSEYIEKGNLQTVSYKTMDFSKANLSVSKNNRGVNVIPKNEEIGNVLLTGATGYLGVHILANFLENNEGLAYCLVRGTDIEDSTKRLDDLLRFYFDGRYQKERIKVICADLQKDNFGMAQQEYLDMMGKVHTVIHAAATVKHYGSYEYFDEVNVGTTRRLIKFCMEAGSRLIHISTLSVSGDNFADMNDEKHASGAERDFYGNNEGKKEKFFCEADLFIGQALENVYVYSKFNAEKIVLENMTQGLQANIMRIGNLTNRFCDGVFQKNYSTNAFLMRIKAFLELGIVPDYLRDFQFEFTPVDAAASAVMTIARHFSMKQTVFHINSNQVVYMDKLLAYFQELGCGLKMVSSIEFTEHLRRTMKESGREYIYETFINDMDADDWLNYDSKIRIENDFTVEYLRRLGFEWPEIGLEYLRNYVNYFRKIGYLEV